MLPCSFRFILYNVLFVVQAHPAIEVWQALRCVARLTRTLGRDSMDTILAYLISFAIIAFGAVWAFVSNAGSAMAPAWLVLGILTVVVGLISLWREYGRRL